MGQHFTLVLDSIDVGQLIDGLRSRAESWRRTAEYMENGDIDDDLFVCEECTDSAEANQIAKHFEAIIASIESQVKEQGGW